MDKLVIIILIIISSVLIISYLLLSTDEGLMINPEVTYCESNGGEYVDGMCVFNDGSECLAIDYYNEECFPGNSLSVAELVNDPVSVEVRVYGKVSDLGQLFCPCFRLTSVNESLQVFYDLMIDDQGNPLPGVNVDSLENGDWVIATGSLRNNDLWLESIEITERRDVDFESSIDCNQSCVEAGYVNGTCTTIGDLNLGNCVSNDCFCTKNPLKLFI